MPIGLYIRLGQTKIQQLHAARASDENICRFDIAVDDPLAVRCLERVGDLDPEIHQQRNISRTPVDGVLQRASFQILHGDESLVAVGANVVDGADIGMVQSGGRAGFATKAFQRLRIKAQTVGKET